jgi:hypothetical protein
MLQFVAREVGKMLRGLRVTGCLGVTSQEVV